MLWLAPDARSANGTFVRQLTYVDDDGDTAAFTLLSTGVPFSLTADGLLYVDTSKGWLNYEAVSVYSLSVGLCEVSNAVGSPLLWASQGNVSLAVLVTNVNEPPYFSVLPNGYTLAHGSMYPTEATPHTANGVTYIAAR